MMYKEIFTKAIIAKGEKGFIDEHIENVDKKLDKALGCYVINHTYGVNIKNKKVIISGTYDVFLWFSYDDDTNCDLIKYTSNFEDEIPFTYIERSSSIDDKSEIKTLVLQEPTCKAMVISSSTISTQIERKYSIDIVGETKLTIKVSDVNIDNMINTEYIKENKNGTS